METRTKESKELQPKNAYVYRKRGISYKAQGRDDEAVQDPAKVLELS